ncbi:MAG: pentapeptide repeat-containing protein [Waterburya sp.]
MTNTSQDRERTNNRITYAATTEGIERAKKALKRQGFASKTKFAEVIKVSRSTVNKFFGGGSIELDYFKRICNELQLSDWKEIADIESFDNNGKVEPEPNFCHQIIEEEKVPFSIMGSVDKKDIAKLKSAIQLLRKLTGDDLIDFIGVEKSSIKLTLKGSLAGLERLKKLFQSGELTKIFEQELNITVEDVSFIDAQTSDNHQKSQTNNNKLLAFTIAGNVNQADIDILKAALIDSSDDEKIKQNEEKSRLVEEIKTQGAFGRNLVYANLIYADLSNANLIYANLSNAKLRGADLSDADLSDADLSDADLSNADLRGADLSNANLSRADLRGSILNRADLSRADLSGANLSGADLSRADLSRADLSGAILSNAKVEKANFTDTLGVSESLKQDLKARGAIFEDSPGDRSEVYTHS